MLRQISEEVRVNVKDRLRDIRQGVRQLRRDNAHSPFAPAGRDRPPFPLSEIEGLLGHAASAFDDAMSVAESLVLRSDRPARATAKSLSVYFPMDGGSAPQGGERAFRRDVYYLAQAVLAKRKIGKAVVHESRLAAVHAAMRRRHADRMVALKRAATPTDRINAAASLCSALLIAMLDHRPVRLAGPAMQETPGDRSAEIRILAPVVLACGVATLGGDDAADPDLLELAMLAVDVRLERIAQACGRADAGGELASVLAMLLAHLP